MIRLSWKSDLIEWDCENAANYHGQVRKPASWARDHRDLLVADPIEIAVGTTPFV